MVDLLGERDAYLRMVEKAFPQVRVLARGNEIDITGPQEVAGTTRTVIEELLILIQEGIERQTIQDVYARPEMDTPPSQRLHQIEGGKP